MKKIKALVIEFGIKNINLLKNQLDTKNIEFIYATSFLDVVDTIHLDHVQMILLSDFRGVKSTVGYIKMFKTTDPNFSLMILSTRKIVQEDSRSYYIQRGADDVVSSHDIKELNRSLFKLYSRITEDKTVLQNWSNCTKRVIRFVKDNYHITDNLVNEAVINTNYSHSSIFHSVKNDTGKSLGVWIQELRVNGAKELLKSTDHPIKQISNMVGYNSTQGFIKVFKKVTGMTPNEYRNDLD